MENDTLNKILEIVVEIKEDVKDLKEHVTALEKRVDALEKRIDNLEKRFDNLEKRIDALEKRFDNLEKRFGSLEDRTSTLEENYLSINRTLAKMEYENEIKFQALFDYIEVNRAEHKRLEDLINSKISEDRIFFNTILKDHETRITALESYKIS